MKLLNKIRLIAFACFILIYGLFYVATTKNKDEFIKMTLEQQVVNLENNYKVSRNHFEMMSNNVYKNILSGREVTELFSRGKHAKTKSERSVIREKLYKKLRPYFEQFSTAGVNLLLFSFENNKTFLRVHKPDKYGDDLSAVRYSFTYVNDKKKIIRGFEQGKISHAFRNVFPLYYGDEYIGSVDFAFSSELLQENMTKIHGLDTHFIVDKSIFDVKIWERQKKINYIQSLEHKDFFFSLATSQKEYTFSDEKVEHIKYLKDEIAQNIKHQGPFSLYDHRDDKVHIITFFPIKNIKEKRTVAYLVSYAHSPFLERIFDKYLVINMIFFIGLLLLLLVTLNNMKQRLYLEQRVNEEVEKNNKQQQTMFDQSRLAQMGEMISMIAHQWRQPLGVISIASMDLKLKIDLETFDLSTTDGAQKLSKDTCSTLSTIDKMVQSLSSTIDDFRNFYKQNKKLEKLDLASIVEHSLNMVLVSLESDNIEVSYEYNSKEKMNLYRNEMMQVVLNILKNSQDNFKEKGTEKPKIHITTGSNIVHICDNGGGISEDIIDKIFDPYFSTKNEKNGTGLGLYMSKMIVEDHHNGVLSAVNTKDGICFSIELGNI